MTVFLLNILALPCYHHSGLCNHLLGGSLVAYRGALQALPKCFPG